MEFELEPHWSEVERICKGCGKKFKPITSKQMYCTVDCRKEHTRQSKQVMYRYTPSSESEQLVFESNEDSIKRIAKEARKNNQSYGEYVAGLKENTKVEFPDWVKTSDEDEKQPPKVEVSKAEKALDISFPSYAKVCPVCKKKFYCTPEHVFKVNGVIICSWTCLRAWEKEKERQMIRKPRTVSL